MEEKVYYSVEPEYFIKSPNSPTLLFPTIEKAVDFLKKSFEEFPSQTGFVVRKVVVAF